MATSSGSSGEGDRTIFLRRIGKLDVDDLRDIYNCLDSRKDIIERVFTLTDEDSGVVVFTRPKYADQALQLDHGDIQVSRLPTQIFSKVTAVVDLKVHEMLKSKKLWKENKSNLKDVYGVDIRKEHKGKSVEIVGRWLEVEQCKIVLEKVYRDHSDTVEQGVAGDGKHAKEQRSVTQRNATGKVVSADQHKERQSTNDRQTRGHRGSAEEISKHRDCRHLEENSHGHPMSASGGHQSEIAEVHTPRDPAKPDKRQGGKMSTVGPQSDRHKAGSRGSMTDSCQDVEMTSDHSHDKLHLPRAGNFSLDQHMHDQGYCTEPRGATPISTTGNMMSGDKHTNGQSANDEQTQGRRGHAEEGSKNQHSRHLEENSYANPSDERRSEDAMTRGCLHAHDEPARPDKRHESKMSTVGAQSNRHKADSRDPCQDVEMATDHSYDKVFLPDSSASGEDQHMCDQANSSLSDDTSTRRTYLIGQTSVHVYDADITQVQVDVIVSPTDQNLCNRTGLAHTIEVAAGPQLTTECIDQITESGQILVGLGVLTTAGNLPCREVYHVVVPTAKNCGKNGILSDLYQAFKNSLEDTASAGHRSIAIPVISPDVTYVLHSAVSDFCLRQSPTSSIVEIHLVDTDREVVKLVQQPFGWRCQGDVSTAETDRSSRKSRDEGTQDRARLGHSNTSGLVVALPPATVRSQTRGHDTGAGRNTRLSKDDGGAKQKHGGAGGGLPPSRLVRTLSGGHLASASVAPRKRSLSTHERGQHAGDIQGKEDKHDDNKGCPICLEPFDHPIELPNCNHKFCAGCLKASFAVKQECPICRTAYGKIYGIMPEDATMTVVRAEWSLPGYESCGTIIIEYHIPSGIQTAEHPHPGVPYQGANRHGLLPDNHQGNKVLRLLKQAFKQRLTFTVGRSVTTGKDNVVTWNDIHHKTSVDGGPTEFGYPDHDYLDRVTEDLAAKGIK